MCPARRARVGLTSLSTAAQPLYDRDQEHKVFAEDCILQNMIAYTLRLNASRVLSPLLSIVGDRLIQLSIMWKQPESPTEVPKNDHVDPELDGHRSSAIFIK
jgi:hypothetical protein